MPALIEMKKENDLLFVNLTLDPSNAVDSLLAETLWDNPLQTSSATDTLSDIALRVTNRFYKNFGPLNVGVNKFEVKLTNGLSSKTFKSSVRCHEWEDNKIQLNPDF